MSYERVEDINHPATSAVGRIPKHLATLNPKQREAAKSLEGKYFYGSPCGEITQSNPLGKSQCLRVFLNAFPCKPIHTSRCGVFEFGK